MFSPDYFEKQSAYVYHLHEALEVAINASDELSSDPNARLKICKGCRKPQLFYVPPTPDSPRTPVRHLRFDNSDSNITLDSPLRHSHDHSAVENGTYVTAVMNTLLNTRSPNNSLRDVTNMSETDSASAPPSGRKQSFLKRRPSMRAEGRRSNERKIRHRQSLRFISCGGPSTADCGSEAAEGRCRTIKARAHSSGGPGCRTEACQLTTGGCGTGAERPLSAAVTSQTSSRSDISNQSSAPDPADASRDPRCDNAPDARTLITGDFRAGQEKTETRNDGASGQGTYYTLSPFLLDDAANNGKHGGRGGNVDAAAEVTDADDCSVVSEASSSSSGRNPEYFAVLKKSRRGGRRRRTTSHGASSDCHDNASECDGVLKSREQVEENDRSSLATKRQVMKNVNCGRNDGKLGGEQMRTSIGSQAELEELRMSDLSPEPERAGSQGDDDRRHREPLIIHPCEKANVTQAAKLSVEAHHQLNKPPQESTSLDASSADEPLQSTRSCQDPGLLSFSNVFEIGDVGGYEVNDSYNEDDDFLRDGYCRCDYCNRNHDDILTSTLSKERLKETQEDVRRTPTEHCKRNTQRTDSPLRLEDLESPPPTHHKQEFKDSPEYQAIVELFCQCSCQSVFESEVLTTKVHY